MGQILFSDFYTLYKDAVDARKSNSKSPHINKVEKECREQWSEYTRGESKIVGFTYLDKQFIDSSVRAAYTTFFVELCKNKDYLAVFKEKGYFYSPEMLSGDKEWEKDFVQVEEGSYFHVDCQVFVFLLKAVRAIIDLENKELLSNCSIIYGAVGSSEINENSFDEIDKVNSTNEKIDISILEEMIRVDNGILFRVEKDAVKHVMDCYKNQKKVDPVYFRRVEMALAKLKKIKLL